MLKSLETLFKFSEKPVIYHNIINIGNVFDISPKISIKFGENFSLSYTKLFKITKKIYENFLNISSNFPQNLNRIIVSFSIFKRQKNISKFRQISFKIFVNFRYFFCGEFSKIFKIFLKKLF